MAINTRETHPKPVPPSPWIDFPPGKVPRFEPTIFYKNKTYPREP